MTDPKIDELKKEVQLLQRRLDREKHARANAENLLESYSEKAYLANQALRRALKDSNKRERELLFLSRNSRSLSQNSSYESLLFETLRSTVQFCDAYCGMAFITTEGEFSGGNWEQILVGSEFVDNPSLATFIKSNLPLQSKEGYTHWCISAVDIPPDSTEGLLLHLMVELENGGAAWLAILDKSDEIDEETLFVLDTTKHYLEMGVGARDKDQALETMLDEKRVLEERLITADKMAILGQLAAGVAHEINNPLGFIKSNTELSRDIFKDFSAAIQLVERFCNQGDSELKSKFERLDSEYNLNASLSMLEELFDAIQSGILRVTDIVKSLRSFSYPTDSVKQAIPISEAIVSAIEITRNLCKNKTPVTYIETEEPVLVHGNSAQLQQVLVNLISNAHYASEAGQPITITVAAVGTEVRCSVIDTGAGMSEKVINQLFTPFFTTKPPGDGTGLGLSLSLAIIEEHGGRFDVQSQEGKGSTVTICLPAEVK